MYVYKRNLKYKMHIVLLWLKLKWSFNSQVNVLKKYIYIIRKFRNNILNASDISFTNFASGGVNWVLHEWYQSPS